MEENEEQNIDVKPKKKKTNWLIPIMVIISVYFCFSIIIDIANHEETTSDEQNTSRNNYMENIPSKTTKPTKIPNTPTPKPTEIPIAPSFEIIQDTVHDMTEVQWKDYLPTLEGLRVLDWQGEVVDVDGSRSNYKIWVDMNPGGFFSTQDVYLTELSKEQVIDIEKGSKIKFSGLITNTVELFGDVTLMISNVEFEIIN